MHYYQHHIGDFIKDTANLDDHQLATYLRLLWSYYDAESPISGNIEDVAFAMRSDEKTVLLILRHYFTQHDDGWRHARCDRELDEYKTKKDKARNSASARWKNAKAMRTHNECNAGDSVFHANQEPITNNQYIDMAKTGAADLSPSSQPADANGVQTSQPKDECPHRDVIALFHEVLPSVRRVRDWTPARAQLLRTRWREDAKRQNLDWWRKFFTYVGQSDFLMGRTHSQGRKPFELGLEWLLKAENFAKVREGAYHEQEVAA